MGDARRKEGEEGRTEEGPPSMNMTRSEKEREENKKRILNQTKNNRRAQVGDFNDNVESTEKEASSTNKVPERAKPSGDRAKGNLMSWCCPQAFYHEDECMFAWCTKCYDEMEESKEERPNTNEGQQKRT